MRPGDRVTVEVEEVDEYGYARARIVAPDRWFVSESGYISKGACPRGPAVTPDYTKEDG